MFTLAQLTDLQMPPLPSASPASLLGKRMFGYLNWHLRRKKVHRRDTLDALVRDLHAQAPDHVVVTGDLTNISLPQEFEAARVWLEELGPAERVSVIPGNHDAYVSLPFEKGLARWQKQMTGDDNWPPPDQSIFPYVREIGEIALIGLNTAVPTPPYLATGRLGPSQLENLATRLARLRDMGRFRVVLIHHPPLPGLATPLRALDDAAALREVLVSEGAELVLYGHNHVQRMDRLNGPNGPIPIVAAPSASAYDTRPGRMARYNLFRIGRRGNSWSCTMTGRGLDGSNGTVGQVESTEL